MFLFFLFFFSSSSFLLGGWQLMANHNAFVTQPLIEFSQNSQCLVAKGIKKRIRTVQWHLSQGTEDAQLTGTMSNGNKWQSQRVAVKWEEMVIRNAKVTFVWYHVMDGKKKTPLETLSEAEISRCCGIHLSLKSLSVLSHIMFTSHHVQHFSCKYFNVWFAFTVDILLMTKCSKLGVEDLVTLGWN